jgi:hypothetical protein
MRHASSVIRHASFFGGWVFLTEERKKEGEGRCRSSFFLSSVESAVSAEK